MCKKKQSNERTEGVFFCSLVIKKSVRCRVSFNFCSSELPEDADSLLLVSHFARQVFIILLGFAFSR